MFTTHFYAAFLLAAAALVGMEFKHKSAPRASQNQEYRGFQRKYLTVFFMASLADWLQGPYLYRLYEEYGYLQEQIAALYIAGYVSAMVAGPLMGHLADIKGRKKMSVVFCMVYAAACVCKLSSTFLALLLGRILSGVATALLTSTFEAWMVFEHNKHDFPSDWLPKIFALATFGNGIVAVFAGIVAHAAADYGGHEPVRPFLVAFLVLGLTAVVLHKTWDENQIPEDDILLDRLENPDRWAAALRLIIKTPKIRLLGAIQALFESAMYTFVFLWTPSIDAAEERAHELDHPPLGIVFGSFMCAMMLGSTLFRVAVSQDKTVVQCLQYAIAGATGCLTCAAFLRGVFPLFICFFGFEMACGVFFPAIATLRGEILPEGNRAGIMGWFRVPLNLLVIVMHIAIRVVSASTLFLVCGALCGLGLLVHGQLAKVLAAEALAHLEAAGQAPVATPVLAAHPQPALQSTVLTTPSGVGENTV